MKHFLIVDASPRKGGNSEVIADELARLLQGHTVIVFKMREKNCNFCLACGACQNKDYAKCVQKDDISALLPVIENCDGVVLATPIYNQQVTAMAKLFIERFYPFFSVKNQMMTNSKKRDKKAALICSCWGSPREAVQKYADWTVAGFCQIGAKYTKALVFDHIPERAQVLERKDYLEQLKELAEWLKA